MSRERFEDMVRKLDDIDHVFFATEQTVEVSREVYFWLEEQSKRVQELEDINSQLGYLLGKVYGQSNFEINDLIKQNKRYREKMQEAKEMASCCGMSAVSILEEALEESK